MQYIWHKCNVFGNKMIGFLRSSDWSCTRGMSHTKIHLISSKPLIHSLCHSFSNSKRNLFLCLAHIWLWCICDMGVSVTSVYWWHRCICVNGVSVTLVCVSVTSVYWWHRCIGDIGVSEWHRCICVRCAVPVTCIPRVQWMVLPPCGPRLPSLTTMPPVSPWPGRTVPAKIGLQAWGECDSCLCYYNGVQGWVDNALDPRTRGLGFVERVAEWLRHWTRELEVWGLWSAWLSG